MTTPKPVAIAQALSERLTQITRENGYHTDAGRNVTRGWGLQALAGSFGLPLIAMHPVTDSIDQSRGSKGLHTRSVELEGIVDVQDSDAPADELDLLYADMLRALAFGEAQPLGGLAKTLDGFSASYTIPEDGGRLAIVTLSFTVTYFDSHEE